MATKESLQRLLIINCIKSVLNTNLEILALHKTLFKNNRESLSAIRKNVNYTKKAIVNIDNIKHIEILRSIYQNIISGKETVFALAPALINSKKCKYWDTTEKGFQEFTELESQANEIAKQQLERQIKEQEMIKKAKEEGKKVEWVYDNVEKRNKPIIVEKEDVNA